VIKRAARALDKLLVWTIQGAAALAFLGVVCLVSYGVIARFLLHKGTAWGEELPLFFNVWFSMLAIPLVLRRRGHIAVEFFVRLFPPKVRRVLIKFVDLLIFAFSVYLVWYGGKFVSVSMKARMATVKWPLGFFYLSVPIGGFVAVLISLQFLLGLVSDKEV
jgi:TRAP-type C4-dicarboxylate transport system permease small subunit